MQGHLVVIVAALKTFNSIKILIWFWKLYIICERMKIRNTCLAIWGYLILLYIISPRFWYLAVCILLQQGSRHVIPGEENPQSDCDVVHPPEFRAMWTVAHLLGWDCTAKLHIHSFSLDTCQLEIWVNNVALSVIVSFFFSLQLFISVLLVLQYAPLSSSVEGFEIK